MNLEQFKEAARKAKEERLKREAEAAVNRAHQPPASSSLSAVLPSERGAEKILGTVSSQCAALPSDALQGIPLSDQEREDIAAGLTPAQARRAAEARVDWIEWALGLERMTQEEAERVASFRKMEAALISARGKMPYLDRLGIPRFPPDSEPKYRHWKGGQPLLDTLLELRAQDWAIDSRVTREGSPDDWQRWQEIKAQRRK